MPKHNKLPIGRYGINKKIVNRNVRSRIGKNSLSSFLNLMW